MNLEKIEELWAKDAEAFFDHRELPELLANDSMETPRLHAKYLQLHNQFKLMLSDAQTKYSKLYKEKWLYYNGKMSQEELEQRGWEQYLGRLLKNEVSNYVESDKDIIKLKQQTVVLQEKINYLDSIIRMINNRGFQIKNALDWLKFSHGNN